MVRRLAKIGAIILLLGMVAYGGICVYANVTSFGEKSPQTVEPPTVDKAAYKLKFEATGKTIYTDLFEENGTVFILHGYWEKINNRYLYKDITIKLDELTQGNIIVTRR